MRRSGVGQRMADSGVLNIAGGWGGMNNRRTFGRDDVCLRNDGVMDGSNVPMDSFGSDDFGVTSELTNVRAALSDGSDIDSSP
jgi:hypothetical protein